MHSCVFENEKTELLALTEPDKQQAQQSGVDPRLLLSTLSSFLGVLPSPPPPPLS
jgi:hypothetical protein